MNILKTIFQKIWAIVMVLVKFCLFMALMLAGAWALAPLGTIHSNDLHDLHGKLEHARE